MSEESATSVQQDAEIPVRFEVKGAVLDLEKVNRMARRMLEKQAEKFRKKYRDVKGPAGEVPTIVIRAPRLLDSNMEVVLEYPESMKDSIKGHDKAVRVA